MTEAPKTEPLPRLSSPRELRIEAGIPRVLSGVASSWPAALKWTLDFFRNEHGNVRVGCATELPHALEGGLPYRLRREDHHRVLSMAELVSLVERSSLEKPCYLNQASLESFPCAKDDLRLDQLHSRAASGPTITSLWLGSAGTRSGFHVDALDNFVVQVRGEKRVLLAAPEQAPFLYPFWDLPSKSRVDPEKPDLRAFPRYREASLYEATLSPGDVLFLPRLWWHYFRSLSPAISVSHWFGPMASAKEQARIDAALGGGFRLRSRIVNFAHLLAAVGGIERRRLYSPPAPGALRGKRIRERLLRRPPG